MTNILPMPISTKTVQECKRVLDRLFHEMFQGRQDEAGWEERKELCKHALRQIYAEMTLSFQMYEIPLVAREIFGPPVPDRAKRDLYLIWRLEDTPGKKTLAKKLFEEEGGDFDAKLSEIKRFLKDKRRVCVAARLFLEKVGYFPDALKWGVHIGPKKHP